ncbi:MAG: glycosyltransferase family 4 protein [Kiritimatiellae bacterium]|nr:glycosyltransferase family 4 protein [Kiritimatiellia bacterium]
MRLAINTLFLIPGKVGGSETYLCSIVRHLAANFPCIKLTLFTNFENDQFFRSLLGEAETVTYRCLCFRARNRISRIIREQTQLVTLVRQLNPDLLWSPGYTAPLRAHCPQVVTIFDMQYKTHPESLNPLGRIVTDILVQAAAVRCQRIMTLSEFGRAEILRYTKAQAARICVTYAGADAFASEAYANNVASPQVRAIMQSASPYVLTVGNSYPHKNIHLLVEAFGRLVRRIPHNLVIVGIEGRGERLVREAITRIETPGRVTRLYNILFHDLSALYRHADLFVFPSLYEGFGLPVLEAMVSGVPVLTTRCGAIPEIGGDTVMYFKPNDCHDLAAKITEMLAMDLSTRKKLVENAKQRAMRFTWKAATDASVNCFRQALGEKATLPRPGALIQ